jgi:hypothetical protein
MTEGSYLKATDLRRYNVSTVLGDRYSADWSREADSIFAADMRLKDALLVPRRDHRTTRARRARRGERSSRSSTVPVHYFAPRRGSSLVTHCQA